MSSHDCWSDTLDYYLLHSNENSSYAHWFDSFITKPFGCLLSSRLNWFELGPGPGTKTAILANALLSINQSALIRLMAIEPDNQWHESLKSTLAGVEGNGRFSFAISAGLQGLDNSWPIGCGTMVTAFHVVYSHEATKSVLHYLDCLQGLPTPSLAIVSAEAKDSAFAEIRRRLRSSGIAAPQSHLDEVLDWSHSHHHQTQVTKLVDQLCRIERDEVLADSNHWFIRFILGISNVELQSMAEDTRELAHRIVSAYINDYPESLLFVPDDVCEIHFS